MNSQILLQSISDFTNDLLVIHATTVINMRIHKSFENVLFKKKSFDMLDIVNFSFPVH